MDNSPSEVMGRIRVCRINGYFNPNIQTKMNATVYYSPAKVESELHVQDGKKKFVFQYRLHGKQSNCTWTTHPLKLRVDPIARAGYRSDLISPIQTY